MSKHINSLALGFLLVPGMLSSVDKQQDTKWPLYEELLGNMPAPLREKYSKLSEEQKAVLFALYQDVSRLVVIAKDIEARHKDAIALLHELGFHGKVSCSLGAELDEKA